MIELVRPTSLLAEAWWEMVDEFGVAPIHGSAYRSDERAELERPGGLVGTFRVRHRVHEGPLVVGGQIGSAVGPSARRRGVATAALRLALGMAARLGIDPALVTCEDDNVASARTIEANAGVLEDVRGTSRRYWVPTGGAVGAVDAGGAVGRERHR